MAGFQTMGGIPKVVATRQFLSNTNLAMQAAGIGGFTQPSALFGNGEQGAWWDFSDLNSMWQSGTATQTSSTTPFKAALESPVGFVADKRQPISGQNQIKNSDLTQGATNWTIGATTYISGNKFVTPGTSTFAVIFQQATALKANTWYYWKMSVENIGGGNFALQYGGTNIINGSQPTGTYDGYFYTGASANGSVGVIEGGGATFIGTFSGLQFYEAPGNHLVQATAGARPKLSRRYNIISSSHDISQSWVNHDAVNFVITGPNNFYNKGSANPNFGIWQQNPANGNGDYTLTVTASAGSCGQIALVIKDNATDVVRAIQNFTLGSGIKTFQINGVTAGATPGFRAEIGTGGVAGDINIYSIDVRLTTDAALAIPQVQRVGITTTDYDTLGFPAYLLFDGATKFMNTAGTVDFSAVNKLAIFAGLTKYSDTIIGSIVEPSGAPFLSFSLAAPRNNGAPNYGLDLRNVVPVTSDVSVSPYTAPTTDVVYGAYDYSGATIGDQVKLQVNGVLPVQATFGTGPIPNQNFTNDSIFIGARNGLTIPYNGRIYGIIIRGSNTQVNANDSMMVQKWMGSKCGKFF